MAEVFFTVATGKSVAAGVAAAAVLTAAMAAFVIVVITSGIVCIGEGTGQQFGYPLIGVTGAAGVPHPERQRAAINNKNRVRRKVPPPFFR